MFVCVVYVMPHPHRCGNIAAILELDEHLNKNFKVRQTGCFE